MCWKHNGGLFIQNLMMYVSMCSLTYIMSKSNFLYFVELNSYFDTSTSSLKCQSIRSSKYASFTLSENFFIYVIAPSFAHINKTHRLTIIVKKTFDTKTQYTFVK